MFFFFRCTCICIHTYIHYITLDYITLHYIELHTIHTLHYITLHTLHYIILHYIRLYYITLHTYIHNHTYINPGWSRTEVPCRPATSCGEWHPPNQGQVLSATTSPKSHFLFRHALYTIFETTVINNDVHLISFIYYIIILFIYAFIYLYIIQLYIYIYHKTISTSPVVCHWIVLPLGEFLLHSVQLAL